MSPKNLTRREFIKAGTIAAAGALMINYPQSLFGKIDPKSRVILIRNRNVLDDTGKVIPDVIQEMLDESVKSLFEIDDIKKAWEKIIKPNDIVGIKTNVWNYLHTPIELEDAIKKRVKECGVAEENISIKDRGVLRDPVFQKATALINTRPMRTHYWSGVGSLIKNYIMFVEKPSDWHDDSCADLAAIWKMPHVVDKTRLNVLVMLTPQFHNVGPHGFSNEYVWKYYGLIVGVDPVACDAVGLKIIEAKRKEFFSEDRPLNPPAKHIELADTRHHLGNADMKKIDIIRIGFEEGILI
ncbi:MAG: DUF362 domain-containing protein [Melioribacteraceae bacterium]|nr:DUF362 domain-containing protein [Melioribacteraceae bacterium]